MTKLKGIVKKIIESLPCGIQEFLVNTQTRLVILFNQPIKTDKILLQQPWPKVTVVCPVYKSIGYIDFVWKSFNKYTKNADFLFIANNATDKVKKYLKDNNLPHLIFENEDKSEHYLKRVYRAYNYGGMNAPGEIIVFVNSDMAFSSDWLENLLKHLDKDCVICSRLVESGKLLGGHLALTKNFGTSYKNFDDVAFQRYVERIKKLELHRGGHFMPCAIYKDVFIKSDGYPIGNRKEVDGSETPGDVIFFNEKLKQIGVHKYTAFDSIVYHIQEGEKDE